MTFNDNEAYHDVSIFISDYCNSIFKVNSIITFYDNKVDNGGVRYINFGALQHSRMFYLKEVKDGLNLSLYYIFHKSFDEAILPTS